jgi:hypothetical protein
MVFKLTTSEIHLRDELQSDLIKAWEAAQEAMREFNAAQRAAKAKVEDAVIMFNKIAENTKAFTDAIAERAQEEIDARSPGWREGECGANAGHWRDEWKTFFIDELDPDWPCSIDIDKPYMDLTELPEEA